MKYVSLIGAMRLYGSKIKDYRGMTHLNHSMANKAFDQDQDYRPFDINRTVGPQGQVINRLRFIHPGDIIQAYGPQLPDTVEMYPILELEWLKDELALEEESMQVLLQLGYMFICRFLAWGLSVNNITPRTWLEYLELYDDCTRELDVLGDAPAVLSQKKLPVVFYPKLRAWSIVLLYGTDFNELMGRCKNQTSSLKEMYHHIPILLSMFMVEFCADRLGSWYNAKKIDMENELKDMMDDYAKALNRNSQTFTYGTASSVTTRDMDFICSILRHIYSKLHDLNADAGIISIREYEHIRGPEPKYGSVRLSGFDINWREEMQRVEKEKKEQAQGAVSGEV